MIVVLTFTPSAQAAKYRVWISPNFKVGKFTHTQCVADIADSCWAMSYITGDTFTITRKKSAAHVRIYSYSFGNDRYWAEWSAPNWPDFPDYIDFNTHHGLYQRWTSDQIYLTGCHEFMHVLGYEHWEYWW